MDKLRNLNGQVSELNISTNVLAMIPQELMELRIIMPFRFDEETKILDVVTARYKDVCKDIAMISEIISRENPNIKGIRPFAVTYENFLSGFSAHYKQVFTSSVAISTSSNQVMVDSGKITSEQIGRASCRERVCQLVTGVQTCALPICAL